MDDAPWLACAKRRASHDVALVRCSQSKAGMEDLMLGMRTLLIAGMLGAVGCGAPSPTDSTGSLTGGRDKDADGGAACTPGVPDPRACDPADTKKTTVCHIPPGNPPNEHTICVGNEAVPAHLAHGDHLGSCCGTTPPPPPGGGPDAGSGGGGGGGGADGGSSNGDAGPII
jgi:hypothetical protein